MLNNTNLVLHDLLQTALNTNMAEQEVDEYATHNQVEHPQDLEEAVERKIRFIQEKLLQPNSDIAKGELDD